jgi:tetratricopeptide (TPR) repeat protein
MNYPERAACAALVLLLCSCARRESTSAQLGAYGEAKVAYAAGRLAEAEKAFAPLAPSLPQAGFLLGKTRFFLGNYEEASAAFARLVARFPNQHEAAIWLARTALRRGDADEAEKLAERLLAGDSSDPRLYYLEAMVKVAKGDFEGALGFFERSTESGEEIAASYFESARLYCQFGQDEAAIERLKRAEVLLAQDSPQRDGVELLIKRLGAGGKK